MSLSWKERLIAAALVALSAFLAALFKDQVAPPKVTVTVAAPAGFTATAK